MKSCVLVLIGLALVVQSGRAQNPVLFTESAMTLGKGNYVLGGGFEYLTRSVGPGDGIPTSMIRVLMISVLGGVAENVNFDLHWRGGLLARYDGGQSHSDWGDMVIWTKINFVEETASGPAFALRTGIKLPSTRYTPGKLGNNQMDYHSQALLSRRFAGYELRGMVGFSIIGDPKTSGSQDDVFSVALASIVDVTESVDTFVELFARKGYQDHGGKFVGRAGVVGVSDRWTWNVFGLVRLAGDHQDFASAFDCSERWSIGILVTRSLTLDL